MARDLTQDMPVALSQPRSTSLAQHEADNRGTGERSIDAAYDFLRPSMGSGLRNNHPSTAETTMASTMTK